MNDSKKTNSKKGKQSAIHITTICNYSIFKDSNNYMVGELKNDINQSDDDRISLPANMSYHPSLAGALSKVSDKLLEKRLAKKCKDVPLQLNELVDVINKHHEWFKTITKDY